MSDRFCAVCGDRDARALLATHLSGGEPVTVCGTHDLMHRRAERPARSLAELREMVMDRRRTPDRRGSHPELDELGSQLARAFAPERRAEADRRQG